MSNEIIVFGLTTGNTKRLTEGVAEGLREGGLEVTLKDVVNTGVEELNEFSDRSIRYGEKQAGPEAENREEECDISPEQDARIWSFDCHIISTLLGLGLRIKEIKKAIS